MTSAVPFQYLGHLLTVPVRAGGVDARFIFDTGIGPNLISESLAARAAAPRTARYSPDGGCLARRWRPHSAR